MNLLPSREGEMTQEENPGRGARGINRKDLLETQVSAGRNSARCALLDGASQTESKLWNDLRVRRTLRHLPQVSPSLTHRVRNDQDLPVRW